MQVNVKPIKRNKNFLIEIKKILWCTDALYSDQDLIGDASLHTKCIVPFQTELSCSHLFGLSLFVICKLIVSKLIVSARCHSLTLFTLRFPCPLLIVNRSVLDHLESLFDSSVPFVI